MERAYRVINASQYTGTAQSAADVLAMCQAITQYTGNVWSIDSEDGQRLVLRETPAAPSILPPALWPVAINQWCVTQPDFGITARLSDAAYHARYMPLASIIETAVATYADSIAARAMYSGFGVSPLPSLLLGGTATVAVTILPGQPDTGYVARAFAMSGASLLTTVVIDSIVKTSKDVCTVTVRNTGVLTAAGILLVHITPPVGGATTPAKT